MADVGQAGRRPLNHDHVGIGPSRQTPLVISQYGRPSVGSTAGQVLDASNGDPLPGVQVSILGFDLNKITDQNGYFRFDKVRAAKQKTVKLTVRKDCYRVETHEATLGNTDLRPALEKLETCT
jgi:hypothetical protein